MVLRTESRKGLTILEVVISITIMVIIFFTAYSIFLTGFKFYKTSQYSTKMMKLAQDRMEQVMNDRGPRGPGEVGAWVRFGDPHYAYMIDVDYYNVTDSSGFSTPPDPHTPFNQTPNYDLYTITLTAKGPLNPDGTDGAFTKSLILKSLIAPNVSFYPTCCEDYNNATGASNIRSSLYAP
jgi:Tfp pilus assembly protein PilE